MREVKFRAWNGEQMVWPDYIDRDGVGHWKENCIPESSDKLMQYTGLKDKNGKEIYERDIIRYNYHLEETDTDFVMEVVFEIREIEVSDSDFRNVGFMLRGKFKPWGKNDGEYWYADIPDLKDTEVIGNIYENPERLGGK